MKIALAQMKMSHDIEDNYNKSVNLIENASKENADLILFPELQLSPFFPQYESYGADNYLLDLNSYYIRGIRKACKENNIYASPNFYIGENGKNYDMSLIINNCAEIIAKQKMIHIAQFPNFYEKTYYAPGEEGFKVFNTPFGKIGIVVCFDRHYPESIRTLALRGAQLILIPVANTSAEPSLMFEWEIKVQAFQNDVNIAMCNRVGREDKMEFSGESLVVDFNGDTILKADSHEELLFCDVDLNITDRKYIDLRRKELYE